MTTKFNWTTKLNYEKDKIKTIRRLFRILEFVLPKLKDDIIFVACDINLKIHEDPIFREWGVNDGFIDNFQLSRVLGISNADTIVLTECYLLEDKPRKSIFALPKDVAIRLKSLIRYCKRQIIVARIKR